MVCDLLLGAGGLDGRALTPLPIEAVVRGYLEGSGWKEYQVRGTVLTPAFLNRALL